MSSQSRCFSPTQALRAEPLFDVRSFPPTGAARVLLLCGGAPTAKAFSRSLMTHPVIRFGLVAASNFPRNTTPRLEARSRLPRSYFMNRRRYSFFLRRRFPSPLTWPFCPNIEPSHWPWKVDPKLPRRSGVGFRPHVPHPFSRWFLSDEFFFVFNGRP